MTTCNPAMLVVARESRRLTQKALAEASGTGQGTVSKAEAGLLVPSSDIIKEWARVLRYDPSFLGRRLDAPALPMTFFRKKKSLSVTAVKTVRATVAIRCMQLETLVRSAEPPENNLRSLRMGGDVEDAAEAARYMRSLWRVPPGPMGDLTQLLEDNGVIVIAMPREDNDLSGLSIYDHRSTLPPVVFVNASAPGCRGRFTLAHELAHLVLHHQLKETVAECEDEADEFAAEFLMPAADIRREFPSRIDLSQLVHMKTRWGVSMGALLMRARSLGRITEYQHSSLWKRMSMLGYRTNEPVEIPREVPHILDDLVDIHLRELGFKDEELSEALGLQLEEFLATYRPVAHRGLRLVR
jgi:Zn-dependent peptidase ImmA (M78 family)